MTSAVEEIAHRFLKRPAKETFDDSLARADAFVASLVTAGLRERLVDSFAYFLERGRALSSAVRQERDVRPSLIAETEARFGPISPSLQQLWSTFSALQFISYHDWELITPPRLGAHPAIVLERGGSSDLRECFPDDVGVAVLDLSGRTKGESFQLPSAAGDSFIVIARDDSDVYVQIGALVGARGEPAVFRTGDDDEGFVHYVADDCYEWLSTVVDERIAVIAKAVSDVA